MAQVDIPKILEAFVLHLETIEQYAEEVIQSANDAKFPPEVMKRELSETVQPSIDSKRKIILDSYS